MMLAERVSMARRRLYARGRSVAGMRPGCKLPASWILPPRRSFAKVDRVLALTEVGKQVMIFDLAPVETAPDRLLLTR
jgi:hypothetical protein